MTVMIKMKDMCGNKDSKFLLFVRAVLSTVVGQFIDNFTFASLAFAPIGISAFEMEWKHIFTSSCFGTFMETVNESIFVPFITIPVITRLKERLVD